MCIDTQTGVLVILYDIVVFLPEGNDLVFPSKQFAYMNAIAWLTVPVVKQRRDTNKDILYEPCTQCLAKHLIRSRSDLRAFHGSTRAAKEVLGAQKNRPPVVKNRRVQYSIAFPNHLVRQLLGVGHD